MVVYREQSDRKSSWGQCDWKFLCERGATARCRWDVRRCRGATKISSDERGTARILSDAGAAAFQLLPVVPHIPLHNAAHVTAQRSNHWLTACFGLGWLHFTSSPWTRAARLGSTTLAFRESHSGLFDDHFFAPSASDSDSCLPKIMNGLKSGPELLPHKCPLRQPPFMAYSFPHCPFAPSPSLPTASLILLCPSPSLLTDYNKPSP